MHTSIQEQFVPAEGIYLLNHSVGRPLVSARQALVENFFDPWESGPADVWPLWIEKVEGFRRALGRLLNAEAGEFCPQVNLSGALTKIVHSLPQLPERKVILCTERDFPSLGFVLGQARRADYELRMIPTAEDSQDLAVWDRYLTNDVAIALVTQVYSNTSDLLPVGGIVEMTRSRDIVSIVDICQGVGVVPVDIQAWQADFVIGSCIKWLCGGPGAAFLWCRPGMLQRCEPLDVGWFSHENPFEFDIRNFRYADNALRFWGGTPSVIPYVLATNSIGVLCDIGVDTVREHNRGLTRMIADALPAGMSVMQADPALRGGTLVLDPGVERERVEAALVEAGVHFDSRAFGLRLSPHIYNTETEISLLISLLLD